MTCHQMDVRSQILLLFKLRLFKTALIMGFLLPQASQALSCRHAHKAAFEAFRDVFREAYLSPMIYRPAQCGLNIRKLLLHFQKENIRLRNPQVVFLLHEKRQVSGGPILPGQLLPAMNRSFERAWLFHVVLKVEDVKTGEPLILDLDSKSTAIPLEKYFETMFPSANQKDRLAMMTARIVDVPSYMLAFEDFLVHNPGLNQNTVVGAFLKKTEYPTLSVRQWIEQIRPATH